ncbi:MULTISPECIES: DNA-methyltransferase [unclassified Blautia]|uniref:DNA-methyltransferase n=1 Tax=unclassified Blautia TaxID=2648079 RepID=UPI003F8B2E81
MSDFDGVICGDMDEWVDKLIDAGIKYDLILTDPPYNINKDFGNDSDKLSVQDFVAVSSNRIKKLKQLLTPTGSIIWFGIHDYICYIQVAMYEAGLYYRRMNIWHYENGFSRSKKEPATHYEPFLWFSNNAKKWTYNVDEVRVPYKSTERLKSPVKYKGSDGTVKIWEPNPKGSMRGDVWDFPTLAGKRFEKEKTAHPTQKPESLITELLKAFCPMKDGKYVGRVLDPFHGSGTLGVCCEKLNAEGNNIQWTGIELEKQWCDIANERLKEIKKLEG